MGVLTEVLALFEPTSPHRTTAFSVLFLFSSAIGYFLFLQPHQQEVKLPFAGVKNTSFVNLFLGRFRFITNAKAMIDEGYRKVCSFSKLGIYSVCNCLLPRNLFSNRLAWLMQYRDQPFQVPTYSNNRVILSSKHVEELRNAPESKLSLSAASSDVSSVTERKLLPILMGRNSLLWKLNDSSCKGNLLASTIS